MNQQNGYDAWAALGLQSLNSVGQSNMFHPIAQQQAAMDRHVGIQQTGLQVWPNPEAMAAVQKYMDNRPETKERRAQRMAQEVRERKPSMQVQRRTRREA